MNVYALRRYLRLTAFDPSTEQGRADERYRLALFTMAAGVVNRAVGMLVMFLTVSLTATYLGEERFGAWMTIASFAAVLAFMDFGVGNALISRVAEAACLNDNRILRDAISGGLGVLSVLSFCVMILLVPLSLTIPWASVIKVGSVIVEREIRQAIILFVFLFASHLLLMGVQRVFVGLQRGYEVHLVAVVGSGFSLLALWFATQAQAGIPYLLACAMGGPLLSGIVLIGILILRQLFTLRGVSLNVRQEYRRLLKVGGLFFLLQIGTIVGWGADSLIISSCLGVVHVAAFNVAQRLFQIITQPMNMMNSPLWVSYADAHVRGEKQFIRKTLRRSLTITFLYAVSFFLVLMITGDDLISLWTSQAIAVPTALIFACGCWAVVGALGDSFAMCLNGCEVVLPQVVVVCLFCLFAIPLKLFLVTSYGVASMVLGFTLLYLAISGICYGVIFRKSLSDMLW